MRSIPIETIIAINGERMCWSYPDITFGQVQYLATDEWRDITPTTVIHYTYSKPDDIVFEYTGVLTQGETLDIRRKKNLSFHVKQLNAMMRQANG